MNDKKYYWIKLKTDFFNQDTIDFLLSQNNGCEYVVLYQMLCLKTANNNGILATNVGEMIVPYDVSKIARDTKYFSEDTIRVALELYKQLGLIYEGDNKLLKIFEIERMVGTESATREAIKKREQRLKKKIEQGTQEGTNCLTEIEYRDKSIDIDIDNKLNEFNLYNNFNQNLQCDCVAKSTKERCTRKSSFNINGKNYCNQHARELIPNLRIKEKFKKPTIDEIKAYCQERHNGINAEAFYDFYESKNWYVGKNKMVDWKACVRTWERREPKKDVRPSWLDKEIKTEKVEVELTDDEKRYFGII